MTNKTLLLLKKISIIFFLLFLYSTNSHAQEVLYYCSRPLPNGTGAWQVYKKNLTTSTVETITNDPLYNYWWVELSPDHSQLVMLRSPVTSPSDQFDYENCEMIKANADGTNAEVILVDNSYNWIAFGNPHWHPTGDRILMIAQPEDVGQPFVVVTIDPDGTNPKQLTFQYSIDANWSPDGNKIVYVGIGGANPIPLNFQINVADYDDASNTISNNQQLTNDNTRNHDPCFSPDGSQIVFSASDALLTNADLITIDADGSNRIAVLDDEGIHGGPVQWASDGKIYHHSIYIGLSDFTVDSYDISTSSYVNILKDIDNGYISPFYANLNISSLTKINESKELLKIHPNPTSDNINIELPFSNENFEIEIFTMLGQRVFQTNEKTRIDISNFEKGIYLLSVRQNNNIFASRIIKE